MNRVLISLFVVSAAAVSAAAERLNLTTAEMAAARKTYVAKCAKCHKFYEPKNYSEGEWQDWMRSMARKSKLKPAQEELLNRYLDAYRAGKLSGKPHDKLPRK